VKGISGQYSKEEYSQIAIYSFEDFTNGIII